MAAQPGHNPARILAPLALVVCAFAFFAILFSAGGGDQGGSAEPAASNQAGQRRPARSGRPLPTRPTYTVKTGDTLAGIANKTGVPVDRLQELNPNLDPQALVSGQKIKLRE